MSLLVTLRKSTALRLACVILLIPCSCVFAVIGLIMLLPGPLHANYAMGVVELLELLGLGICWVTYYRLFRRQLWPRSRRRFRFLLACSAILPTLLFALTLLKGPLWAIILAAWPMLTVWWFFMLVGGRPAPDQQTLNAELPLRFSGQPAPHVFDQMAKGVADTVNTVGDALNEPQPALKKDGIYIHNEVPKKERIQLFVIGALLAGYGVYGWWQDDIFVPSRHHSGHLHGLAAWLAAGAMFAIALTVLSVIVDHYDQRNNERSYHRFRKIMKIIACLLAAGAGLSPLFVKS